MRMRLLLSGAFLTLLPVAGMAQTMAPVKVAPDNPQACLTLVDELQQKAEDKATTRKVDDQSMERLGQLISTLESQCQSLQFTDALGTANDLVTTINQIP